MPVLEFSAATHDEGKRPPRPGMARRAAGVLFFLLAALPPAGAAPRPVTLLTWNVENLFDEVDDGWEYPDFRVAGGNWGPQAFGRKVERLAEVIRRAVPGGPDVVALQEVESLRALQALRDRGLKGLGYRFAVLAGGEAGAARPATLPAVLSRLPVRRTGYHQLAGGAGEPLRGILEVELEVGGHPLHLFVNHWKSRTGGAAATEPARREAARVLAGRIRALLAADPAADIVALGDLNAGVEEIRGGDLALTDRPERAGWQGTRLLLYETWYERPRPEWGSYVFRGRWQTLDHILLSAGLFDRRGWPTSRAPSGPCASRSCWIRAPASPCAGTPRRGEAPRRGAIPTTCRWGCGWSRSKRRANELRVDRAVPPGPAAPVAAPGGVPLRGGAGPLPSRGEAGVARGHEPLPDPARAGHPAVRGVFTRNAFPGAPVLSGGSG